MLREMLCIMDDNDSHPYHSNSQVSINEPPQDLQSTSHQLMPYVFQSRAACAITVTTLVRICTLASTTVIDEWSGRIDLPISHALDFIPITPVAFLTHVSLSLDHLLLGPDGMTSLISLRTNIDVAGRSTSLLVKPEGYRYTGADSLQVDARLGADRLAASVTELRAGELRDYAHVCACAIFVAQGLVPWL